MEIHSLPHVNKVSKFILFPVFFNTRKGVHRLSIDQPEVFSIQQLISQPVLPREFCIPVYTTNVLLHTLIFPVCFAE